MLNTNEITVAQIADLLTAVDQDMTVADLRAILNSSTVPSQPAVVALPLVTFVSKEA